MDDDGKVVGETRRYDPYSKFGHIMLYEIDSFGFVPGYVSRGLRLMSEEDLKADPRLKSEFEESQYQVWKRHNIQDLLHSYERCKKLDEFELFCRRIYEKINLKQ